jgi:hypothetical protein
MSRNLMFVLLLATNVALAEAQAKTEGAQSQPQAAPAKTEGAQSQPQAAPAKTDAAEAKTEEAPAKTEDGKLISTPGGKALGMSILGNQEAPTSLVIVPWKTSELGGALGGSPLLDDSRQPIDKEVFMRALLYYDLRSKPKP